jgi:hypothetical protein
MPALPSAGEGRRIFPRCRLYRVGASWLPAQASRLSRSTPRAGIAADPQPCSSVAARAGAQATVPKSAVTETPSACDQIKGTPERAKQRSKADVHRPSDGHRSNFKFCIFRHCKLKLRHCAFKKPQVPWRLTGTCSFRYWSTMASLVMRLGSNLIPAVRKRLAASRDNPPWAVGRRPSLLDRSLPALASGCPHLTRS